MERSQDYFNLSVTDFLKKLSSESPTPGGGSAAAVAGAMGAALVSMVCNLSLGKGKYLEHENLIKTSLEKANLLLENLLQCARDDVNAYNEVMNAFKLPKDSTPDKNLKIENACKNAIIPPENTIKNCEEIIKLAKNLFGKSNKNASSDLNCAQVLAEAGIKSALENVKINLNFIGDENYIKQKNLWLENF